MPSSAAQNIVAFPAPDEQQAAALSADIQAQLSALPIAIADAQTYQRAKESLPVLKRYEDRVVEFFKDIKRAAHDAHKAITTKEAAQLQPVKQARERLARLIYGYEAEQERQRREAERVAAEQEQQRMHAAALEEAAALSSVAPEMAEQIVEQALAAPAPAVALPTRRLDVAGVSSSENWQFKFAGCASGLDWDKLPTEDRERVMRLLPREYLRPDEKAIGKVVKALKGSTRIPGVEVFDAGTVRVRG